MTPVQTTLANGFRVVIDPVPTVETVTMGVWVGIGSRHERDDADGSLAGASHFLEHMAFKGTATLSAAQIAERIEDVGGYLNAYTSRDVTAYHARVLSGDSPRALHLLADILQDSVFDPTEFERERQVILQEIAECDDTPDDVAYDLLQATAFPDQPLGRPILGSVATVNALTPARLRRYMDTHYAPSSMVLAVSGNVDPEEIMNLADGRFGGMASIDEPRKPAPGCYGGGQAICTRPTEQAQWVLAYPGVGIHDDRHLGMALLASLLGGGMSSRLFQSIREQQGLAYTIYASHSAYADVGLFSIHAGTDPKDVDQVRDSVRAVLERTHADLTASHPSVLRELARAKAQWRAGACMALESLSARAERLASQLLRWGRVIPHSETFARIEALRPHDLASILAMMLESLPTDVCVGPSE